MKPYIVFFALNMLVYGCSQNKKEAKLQKEAIKLMYALNWGKCICGDSIDTKQEVVNLKIVLDHIKESNDTIEYFYVFKKSQEDTVTECKPYGGGINGIGFIKGKPKYILSSGLLDLYGNKDSNLFVSKNQIVDLEFINLILKERMKEYSGRISPDLTNATSH